MCQLRDWQVRRVQRILLLRRLPYWSNELVGFFILFEPGNSHRILRKSTESLHKRFGRRHNLSDTVGESLHGVIVHGE